VALLPLLLLVALVATVGAGAAAVRRSPPSRETAVAAARAHAGRAAVAAYALGAAAALYVGQAQLGNSVPGGLGVTALLVPLTFGVVHIAVLAIGELTWPRPQAEVRRARLVRRRLLGAAPAWLVRAAAAVTALAVLVLVAGPALAADDGRSFGAVTADGLLSGTAGPFPGLFYARPAAIGLLVLAAATAGSLWIVATRPAVATEDERIEEALRRASAHRVLRTAVGVASFVAGGLLFVGGNAVHSVGTGSAGSELLRLSGVVAALLGLVALLAGVVLTCTKAPGVPADARRADGAGRP
jgi:hypothetical protein